MNETLNWNILKFRNFSQNTFDSADRLGCFMKSSIFSEQQVYGISVLV